LSNVVNILPPCGVPSLQEKEEITKLGEQKVEFNIIPLHVIDKMVRLHPRPKLLLRYLFTIDFIPLTFEFYIINTEFSSHIYAGEIFVSCGYKFTVESDRELEDCAAYRVLPT
jgi:hypothetical protein